MNRTVRPRRRAGFTLLEMLVSIAILGILLAIGVWNYRHGLAERQLEGAFREVLGLVHAARDQALTLGGTAGEDVVEVQFQNNVNGNLQVNAYKLLNGVTTGTPPTGSTMILGFDSPPEVSVAFQPAGTSDLFYLSNGALDQTKNIPSSVTLNGVTEKAMVVVFSSGALKTTDQHNTPGAPLAGDQWYFLINADTGIPTTNQ